MVPEFVLIKKKKIFYSLMELNQAPFCTCILYCNQASCIKFFLKKKHRYQLQIC